MCRNLEESARRARYDFLRRAAAAAGATKIAVGHTVDDQAETVLLRLLRGSGTRGMGGIYPVLDGLVVRPLIEVSGDEIRRYLQHAGVAWREDSSNLDLRYRRNRVRHELLPYLRGTFNPNIAEVLAREAAIARDVTAYLDDLSRAQYDALRRPAPGGVALGATALAELHPALQRGLLQCVLRECRGSLKGITAAHIDAVLALALEGASGRTVAFPGGAASRQFDELLVVAAGDRPRIERSYALPLPGCCFIEETGMTVTARVDVAWEEARTHPDHRAGAVLAADRLPASLLVRGRMPGDRYGGTGHRKVKKMLIDARIPLAERAMLPMVVAGDAVVWVPGFPPAQPFAPGKDASRCVFLEIRTNCGGSI